MVEMGDKKLEEFLRRNDLTDLCMVVQEFKDLMIWDICQQTIAPPLDICNISPDPGGEICHSVFQNGKFPWVSPGSPPSVITMTSALQKFLDQCLSNNFSHFKHSSEQFEWYL